MLACTNYTSAYLRRCPAAVVRQIIQVTMNSSLSSPSVVFISTVASHQVIAWRHQSVAVVTNRLVISGQVYRRGYSMRRGQ